MSGEILMHMADALILLVVSGIMLVATAGITTYYFLNCLYRTIIYSS